MRILVRIPLFAVLAVLCACTSEGGYKLPGVYRIDVQQGNVITQDMLDRLKPGMDKNQVRFVMGTPAVESPFHADRWDYIFSMSKGGARREQRHVSVYFKDGKLTHVDGNVVASANRTRDELKPRAAPVEVELEDRSPGFFSRMFNALPFVGRDEGSGKAAAQPDDAGDSAESSVDDETDATTQADSPEETPADPAAGATAEAPLEAEEMPAASGEEGAVEEMDETGEPPGEVDPSSGSAEARRAVFGPDPEPEPLPDPGAERPSVDELPSEDME